MKMTIKNTRLSFANLWQPVAKFGGDPKYEASFILDPKSPDGNDNLNRFRAIVRQLENEAFDGVEMPTDKLPIKDGNDKDYDGWKDMLIISASDRGRPVVVDWDKHPVLEGEDGAPYSGCMVDASINIWAMNNKFGKRICASLLAVRFRADGDSFKGSSVDLDADFADDAVDELDAA